jgi:histidine triad (HIT) family protein
MSNGPAGTPPGSDPSAAARPRRRRHDPRRAARRTDPIGAVTTVPPRSRRSAGAGPDTFCQIVAGDLAAAIVHSDKATMAFLDHRPLFQGHVLLVPRHHVTVLADLPASDVDRFFRLAQRLEVAVERATGSDGSLVLVNNRVSQSVPHLHVHVIPRRFRDGLRFWLGPRRPYPSPEDAERMAAAIRDNLDVAGL